EYETLFKTTSTEIPNYIRFVGKRFLNYYIDISNVRLIFIDTGYDYYFSFFAYNGILPEPEASGLTASQINFLKSALETSTNRFNIILTHHPFLNKDDEGIFLFNRDEFYNLTKSNKVSLILSGHTHENRVFDSKMNLVRSFPITNINDIYHVQTGSIGKDGYFRMIEVFEWGIVINKHSNISELLNSSSIQ
ncbi:MAG: metallophosphoesterase, partial [Spirochaetes bacterium]|nr:metallophosphoesterase [Spirochaetota bacterium]